MSHREFLKSNGYILSRLLGSGGEGDVFLACQILNNKFVAIKICDDSTLITNHKLLQTLSHPNLLRIQKVLENEKTNKSYIIMDFIHGIDLVCWLKQAQETMHSKKDHCGKVAQILQQICRAVRYLHAQGFAHRDLKLENILVDPLTLKITIIDFGMAVNLSTTKDLQFCGSTYYLSPELVGLLPEFDGLKKSQAGEDRSEETPGQLARERLIASDVWAIGIIMFVLLSFHFPFGGGRKEIFRQILNSEIAFNLLDKKNKMAIQLLEQLLVRDFRKRISLRNCLAQSFFSFVVRRCHSSPSLPKRLASVATDTRTTKLPKGFKPQNDAKRKIVKSPLKSIVTSLLEPIGE